MIFGKFSVLPVLAVVAILSALSLLSRASEVKLFDQDRAVVDIGDVSPEKTTVGEFKKIVASKTGVELNNVRLTTTRGLPLLNDDDLLSEYLSIFEEALSLKICDDLTTPGEIHVDLGDNRMPVVVKKDETIADLKKEALGNDVDLSLYRVFHQGRDLNDNSKTLGELKFYKGAYVVILKNDDTFKVNVVTSENEEKKFDVKLDISVDDLTQMIRESGINLDNKLLVHYRRVMKKGTKLINQTFHPFHNGFVVHIVSPFGESGDKLAVFQKKPEGGIEHYSVMVNSTTTLGELKKFANEAGISIATEEMKLRLTDQVLDGDSRTLAELNLYPGAWIEALKGQ